MMNLEMLQLSIYLNDKAAPYFVCRPKLYADYCQIESYSTAANITTRRNYAAHSRPVGVRFCEMDSIELWIQSNPITIKQPQLSYVVRRNQGYN